MDTHTHTHIYIYIYIYISVCLYVCMYVCMYVCVCVCVCVLNYGPRPKGRGLCRSALGFEPLLLLRLTPLIQAPSVAFQKGRMAFYVVQCRLVPSNALNSNIHHIAASSNSSIPAAGLRLCSFLRAQAQVASSKQELLIRVRAKVCEDSPGAVHWPEHATRSASSGQISRRLHVGQHAGLRAPSDQGR